MKNIFFSLFLFTCLSPFLSQAQSSKTSDKKNIVKLNFTPLIYRTISLQYERILGQKTSVALGLNVMPNGKIPFTRAFENTLEDSIDINIFDSKMSVLNFAPEFRYYFKEAGRGVYVAPYLKYRMIKTSLPINYVDDNNQNQTISIDGRINTFMVGLMFGSQFRLSDYMTLDWFIAGGHLASNKITSSFKTSQTLSAADQQDIKDSFEDLKDTNTRFNNIEYTVSANSGSLKGNFLGFGLRGAGLCLGFRF